METKCHFCHCKEKIRKSLKDKAQIKKSASQDPLQNWKRWLQERQKVHQKISKVVGRSAGSLVMNLGEECRSLQEDRTIIENTNVITTFDKYRGNPEFWNLPYSLPNRQYLPCKCLDPDEAQYFSNKTAVQRNEIATIQYTATPDLILSEKNILPRTRNIYKRWRNSSYRKQCFDILAKKIQQIQPHRPDFSNLCIVGKKITDIYSINQETLSSKHASERSSGPSYKSSNNLSEDAPSPFASMQIPEICFMVNGVKFSIDDPKPDVVSKFRLLFDTDECNRIHTDYLTFSNEGQTVLRLYWKKIQKYRMFKDLLPSNNIEKQTFYFDKSMLLLIPGKKLSLPIWFKPIQPGNYFEHWELSTTPIIWDDDFRITIQLQGICNKANFKEWTKSFKEMLENRMKFTLVKELLDNIYDRSKYQDTPTKTMIFSEAELFESANMVYFGLEKKPKYIFNMNIVESLRNCYNEMRTEDEEPIWNYSAKDLLEVARKRDVLTFIENQVQNCKRMKLRRDQLNGKLEETAGKPLEQVKGVQSEENNFQEETCYTKVQSLLHTIERPCVIFNTQRRKYMAAYMIIHDYLSKICCVLEDISIGSYDGPYHAYNYRKLKQLEDLPERLIFERFDETWVKRMNKQSPEEQVCEFYVAPKDVRLQNIPKENTKAILAAYQSKQTTIIDESAAKNKFEVKILSSSEERPKDTPGRKSKSKLLNKISVMLMGPIKKGFNPFEDDEFPSTIPDSYSNSTSTSSKSYSLKVDYDYDKYLAVYTLLGQAIDTLVDTIETFKDNVAPLALLSEVSRCTRIKINRSDEDEEDRVDVDDEVIQSTNNNNTTYLNDEDNEYFKFLLANNLNENTTKYVIHGDTNVPPIVEAKIEQKDSIGKLLPYSFRSHESIEIINATTSFHSFGVQTSNDKFDFEPITNELLEIANTDNNKSTEVQPNGSEAVDEEKDIFYIMDDNPR